MTIHCVNTIDASCCVLFKSVQAYWPIVLDCSDLYSNLGLGYLHRSFVVFIFVIVVVSFMHIVIRRCGVSVNKKTLHPSHDM